jgi:transcriptional regulator with XRE-family HTH domain
MKLTQKQLASLAKVSTPTISRFENDEKDLQLSSVLAILDVLGMTDKRTLVFTDPEFQRDTSDAIVFWGRDGETKVRCRISREALDDHFSEGDKLRPEAAFKKHRREIEALARRKYLYGQREPDGSVFIQTLEIA